MENANLWTRRSNSSKLSLSMTGTDNKESGANLSRTSKRFGPDSSHGGRSNPFNALSPLSAGVSSPSTNASSAFGLGSGAFASFGAPKTPGGTSDLKTPGEKRDNPADRVTVTAEGIKSKISVPSLREEHPLRSTWIIWYRPPTPKYSDYEKSTAPLASISSVESFWSIYSHLKRPSLLPTVSDYHIFKKGIRPVWEDEANKKGGKWVVRLKKGVADRYWEDLLLAMVGDQFAEASDEVCGAVLSVRSGEDVLSVWTRIDGGRNIKIRETIKRLLAFPADTNIVWKSHDDSIAQRSAIDQARQEKAAHHHNQNHHHNANPNNHHTHPNQHHQFSADRRRPTTTDDSPTGLGDKGKGPAS
ncbi:translation initiation factor eIF 4e-like domain-containing protein [Aspergillus pseudodeflectus]|uniref:Translation initiation factor eIF 4e-like domain-containing protein n=2 Tax=Aspergillus subgen. Nidulantes TaxID=2720870 RepID=A0ABR4K0Y7_9EURO|nr:Putative Translation initiation factor eIF4E3 [Aspergillus calidoustus]